MEKVKCDHCGVIINKEDAIPCAWEEINETWFYCKKCNEGVFGCKLKLNNRKAIDKLKSNDSGKSFSIK